MNVFLMYVPYWYESYTTYIFIVLPVVIISLIISGIMKSTFKKYSLVSCRSHVTGAQMCERVLRENGIMDVRVELVEGELTDHYDPKGGVIRLSRDVYHGTSVASLGVACHEAGHAVQHECSYVPYRLRSLFVPVANIGTSLSWIVIILGIVLSIPQLTTLGVVFFSFGAIFQLITLPVEFNASSRAVKVLRQSNVMSDEELKGTRKVLRAAAMTYVAALAVSVANLLRILVLTRNNRR